MTTPVGPPPRGAGPAVRVHSSVHPETGRPIAVKVYPRVPDRRTEVAFDRERAALGRLRQAASVVRPETTVEWPDGSWGVITEICPQSLAELVATAGPRSVFDVAGIGEVVASVLAEAHDAGLVHGGLTPTNVLFRASGQPVLSDFGLSLRHAFPRGPEHGVGYAAPELLRGDEPDIGSDLYGLGALMYFALTGKQPFPSVVGEDPSDQVLRVLSEPAPALTGVPAELARLVAALLAKDPADRPAATEVVATLRAVLVADSVRRTAPARPSRTDATPPAAPAAGGSAPAGAAPVDPGGPPPRPPAAPAPTGPAPTGPAPTGPAPTGPAPTGPAPTGPAPTGPAPTGQGSTGPTPAGPAPTNATPVAPVPSSSAPTSATPTHPTPTHPTPISADPTSANPTGPAPAGPAPAGPAPAGPAPTGPAPTGAGVTGGPGSVGPGPAGRGTSGDGPASSVAGGTGAAVGRGGTSTDRAGGGSGGAAGQRSGAAFDDFREELPPGIEDPTAGARPLVVFGPDRARDRSGGLRSVRTRLTGAAQSAKGWLAVGAAVVALLAMVPVLFGGDGSTGGTSSPAPTGGVPTAPPSTPAPSTPAPSKPAVQVSLAPPVDRKTSVQLRWTAPPGLTFAVIIAKQGEKTRPQMVGQRTSANVPVEPAVRYCFLIQGQGTTSKQLYESRFRPIRGAVCKNTR